MTLMYNTWRTLFANVKNRGESLLATQVSIRFFGFRLWQSPFLSESKEVESSDSVAPRAGQLQQRMEK